MTAFKKAERDDRDVKMALMGPAGCGKTFSGLTIATELAKHLDTKIAVIDTERRSASLYADMFDFDTLPLDSYEPQKYIEGIKAAAKAGYGILIIDSLSHAWAGQGGILDTVDAVAARSKSGNTYIAWRSVTPLHNQLVDTILNYPGQVIVTMRTKMDYVQEKNDRTGKTEIRKVGLKPIQREDVEYEFDIVCDMDLDHNLVVSKTRCHSLTDKRFHKPGADFTQHLIDWVGAGLSPKEREAKQGAVEEAAHREQLLKQITTREKRLYKVAVAIDNAHMKYLGVLEPERATTEKLEAYNEHMAEKWRASREQPPTRPEVVKAISDIELKLLNADAKFPQPSPDTMGAMSDDRLMEHLQELRGVYEKRVADKKTDEAA